MPKVVEEKAPPCLNLLPKIVLRKGEQIFNDSTSGDSDNALSDTVSARASVASSEPIADRAAPPIAELRARLNRGLLARSAVQSAPPWVRRVAGEDLKREQVDSLYARLGETVARISRANISSRSDGLVMDMAEYAGVLRAQAQRFYRILRRHWPMLKEESERARDWPAAAEAAINEKRVRVFTPRARRRSAVRKQHICYKRLD